MFSAWPSHTPSRSFAERFKYRVISSSLLSSSLQAPHAPRSPNSMPLPGKLHRSRTPSIDVDQSTQPFSAESAVSPPEFSYTLLSIALACVVALYANGYPFLGFSTLLGIASFLYSTISTREIVRNDVAPVSSGNGSSMHCLSHNPVDVTSS